MRITADREVCIGSGNCARTAPEVFDQDDDGLVLVTRAEPEQAMLEPVGLAVELCPVAALLIEK